MPPRDRLVHGTIVRHGCERQKVARMSLSGSGKRLQLPVFPISSCLLQKGMS
jgi:hypothetical protein